MCGKRPAAREALHTGSRIATPSSVSNVRQPRHASALVAMFVPPPTAALSERQAQQSRGYVPSVSVLLIMFLSSQDFAPRRGDARRRHTRARESRATATKSRRSVRARDTRATHPRCIYARTRHRPTLGVRSARAPRAPETDRSTPPRRALPPATLHQIILDLSASNERLGARESQAQGGGGGSHVRASRARPSRAGRGGVQHLGLGIYSGGDAKARTTTKFVGG